MIMLKILAATSNKHKVMEFKTAFAPLLEKMTIITQDDSRGFQKSMKPAVLSKKTP